MTAAPRHVRRHSLPVRYGVAAIAACAAVVIEAALHRWFGPQYRFAAFAPAVAFSAWFGGFGPGLVAVACSVAGSAAFHLDSGTALLRRSDRLALLAFSTCWVLLSLLAGRIYVRLRREGEWRMEAERMARQADRLEQFTSGIASARTTQAAIESTVQEAVFAVHADAGALVLLGDEHHDTHVARAVGYPEDFFLGSDVPSLDPNNPFGDAVSRRVPVFVDSSEDLAREYGRAAEKRGGRFESIAFVPLAVGGRVIAVLRLDLRLPAALGQDDRRYLAAIAPRAAQALDRTTQYEAAQKARAEAERERARADEELAERERVESALRASQTRYRGLAARTSRLHELSAALSDAVSLDAVARALLHHGKIAVGATAAGVMVLVGDGTQFQPVCMEDSEGRVTSGGEPVGVVAGLSATAAVERRHPVFIRSFLEWQQLYWRSAALAADGGYDSSAALPLLVEGRPIGVLEFHFTVPVNFDEEYATLLVSVAQHSAQALDRARLYESAQRDRAEAERANRLKDDFLSVVSHELRTPLNSIAGWATMLQKGQLDEALTSRALQAIRSNAGRQAQLIDELLDFSRIVAGRVKLEASEVDLAGVLASVADSVLSMAATKGVALQVDPLPPAVVTGDARRLEQVFLNLLGNALKFTPAGGSVRLGAALECDRVKVTVEDTGLGIEPEFLPCVFDRFRQSEKAVSHNCGGLGLGLSIAKELVEAHEGTVAVASEGPGRGAAFTVTLPLSPAPCP